MHQHQVTETVYCQMTKRNSFLGELPGLPYRAPIIKSQNHQQEKDCQHSEHDYKINLKAEIASNGKASVTMLRLL